MYIVKEWRAASVLQHCIFDLPCTETEPTAFKTTLMKYNEDTPHLYLIRESSKHIQTPNVAQDIQKCTTSNHFMKTNSDFNKIQWFGMIFPCLASVKLSNKAPTTQPGVQQSGTAALNHAKPGLSHEFPCLLFFHLYILESWRLKSTKEVYLLRLIDWHKTFQKDAKTATCFATYPLWFGFSFSLHLSFSLSLIIYAY